jgi:hypothetical protein
MRDHLRIGSRLSWVVAWGMAAAAPALYLLWPGDVTWWLAPLLIVPLVGLAEWRREQKGQQGDHAGSGGDATGGRRPPTTVAACSRRPRDQIPTRVARCSRRERLVVRGR